MTRHFARKFQILSVVAVLIILATLAFPAQVWDTKHASAAMGAITPAQALDRSLSLAATGAQPTFAIPSQREGSLGGPMDSNPLIFLYLPTSSYWTDEYGITIAVGDVNGDGKPDLVVGNCGPPNGCPGGIGSVSVLLGNGDGTFQPAVTYASGGYGAYSVTVADVNGDGKPDLLVANCGSESDCFGDGVIGVLLGNGDGTFQPAVSYDAGAVGAGSVAVADLNGDGKPDLAVTTNWNEVFGSVGVLLGNGDGTFQPAVIHQAFGYAIGAGSVAIADLNGDGNPDMVVGGGCDFALTPSCGNLVAVLLGNGDGTFQSPVTYNSDEPSGSSVSVGDVNGDGKPDLLAANQSGTVGVLLGNGDGTFQSVVTYVASGLSSWPGGPFSVTASDVNGDGRLDLVVASGGVGVLLGNGDGTFQPMVLYDPSPVRIAVADVNGDGKPDVAFVDVFGGPGVLLNNNGAPPTATSLVSSENPATINQVVTYTATVTPQSGAAANGTVVFMDGLSIAGTASLEGNHATLTESYGWISMHPITAIYSGDLNQAAGSVSSTLTETVLAPSKTTVTSSVPHSSVGQPVTFTAKVKSKYGTIPNGESIAFYDQGTEMGTATTASGVATFTTSSLTPGKHLITATYGGDTSFAASSATLTQVVEKYATTTALVSSLNPSNYGQAVTFTATATPTGPYPLTAKVTFRDGTLGIGSAALSGGVATLTKSKLAVGTHSITATYDGDAFNGKSVSPAITQNVNEDSVSVVLTSPNP
jgi:hypothetical protein